MNLVATGFLILAVGSFCMVLGGFITEKEETK